jgi:hypothetical protein
MHSRTLPLSVRIPVLAGVATVSSCPEHWIDKLDGAAAPPHQASLLYCLGALGTSIGAELPATRSRDSGNCRNLRNRGPANSRISWQKICERGLFRQFSAT